MRELFSAFWRAAAYCLHPRVILWSLLPLMVAGGAVAALGWAYWENTVAAVRGALEQWSLVSSLLQWLESIGANSLRTLLAPMIVVALAVPVIVMSTLMLVALMVTPTVVRMVAERRFPQMERREGGAWWQSLLWSLSCTFAALVALILSVPLWFIPPLVLILPPLIWGWLTCRVFAFDVLSVHASSAERRFLIRAHGGKLLLMGVICGYMGAAPSLLWAASVATLVFAPVLVVLSVWLYTLVFAFASCWFAHYLLDALQTLRKAETAAPAEPAAVELPALPHAA
jgi:Etoposide-induced protein 2.4 (EI24)